MEQSISGSIGLLIYLVVDLYIGTNINLLCAIVKINIVYCLCVATLTVYTYIIIINQVKRISK